MNLENLSTNDLVRHIKLLLEKYNENSTISKEKYEKFKELQSQEEKKIRLSTYFLWMFFFMILGLILPHFYKNTQVLFILLLSTIILLAFYFIIVYGVLPLISYNRILTYRIRVLIACIIFSSTIFYITSIIYINQNILNLTNLILFVFFVYILLGIGINALQNFLEKKIFVEIEFYICQKKYFNDKYYKDIFDYETLNENEEIILKRKRYLKKIKEYREELKKRK